MWSKQIAEEIQYSEQSISDEEESDRDSPSYRPAVEVVEGLQVASQLEILKGTHEKELALPHKPGFSFDDEVEIPVIYDKDGFICPSQNRLTHISDEDIISDDEENTFLPGFTNISGAKKFQKVCERDKQDEESEWFAVTKEAKELILLNENAVCAPSHNANCKESKFCRGDGGKGKPKFAFPFQPHKEDKLSRFITTDKSNTSSKFHQVPEGQEATIDCRKLDHSMAELLEDIQGVNTIQNESQSTFLRGSSKMSHRRRGKEMKLVIKKSTSVSGNGYINSRDTPDLIGIEESSDNEVSNQNLKFANPETTKESMADLFLEAFGASNIAGFSFAAPSLSGIGLFGRLQQVMQNEKESDLDFPKKLRAEEEANCIDVRLLSKYFDAKLTVCDCLLHKKKEQPQRVESHLETQYMGGRKRTIIFNSRACGDVELEVGNLIRIYHPWKEVQVMGDADSTILATYFSQIVM